MSGSLITGHAVVHLRNGNTYVGRAVYDGYTLTGSMSLRVAETIGDTTVFSLRPPRRRTVMRPFICGIVWDDNVAPL
jgi:hypothetical protein